MFLGRKTLHKGVGELLEAMRLVWPHHPQAELVLAGARTSDAAEIARRITTLPPEQQARVLVNQAIEHLADHGEEANLLRALARFAIERNH